MRLFFTLISTVILCQLISMPVFAEVVVKRVPVQVGIFKEESKCIPDDNYKPKDNCLCEAKIYKPQISGISAIAAQNINQFFAREVDPKNSDDTFRNSCHGKQIKSKAEAVITRMYDFKVGFNACSILEINTEYYDYESGMAHGNGYESRYLFNVETGEKYTYRQLFGDDLRELNFAITKAMESRKEQFDEMQVNAMQKGDNNLWVKSEYIDRESNTVFITENGIEISLSGFLPRISGKVTVPISTNFIKDTKLRKCLEELYAPR